MRYKEFNRNFVLEKSIALFWNNSFGGCPISDIVDATNVNRYSLYAEFENKKGILYDALTLYTERYYHPKRAILSQQGNLLDLLSKFFESFLEADSKLPSGCFLIHISTELADQDDRIKDYLNTYLSDLEINFAQLLGRFGYSKRDGQFYAQQLVGLFCTVVSFSLIHSPQDRSAMIDRGINVILEKTLAHASST